jgi:hypothetical protein
MVVKKTVMGKGLRFFFNVFSTSTSLGFLTLDEWDKMYVCLYATTLYLSMTQNLQKKKMKIDWEKEEVMYQQISTCACHSKKERATIGQHL